MTKAELIIELKKYNSNRHQVGLNLFLVLEEAGTTIIRQADLNDDLELRVKNSVLNSLESGIIDKEEDISLLDLSSCDDRKNVLYKYDLEEYPEKLNKIISLYETAENEGIINFNFLNDNFKNIKVFLIVIGTVNEKIILFRQNFPINIMSKDKIMFIEREERLANLDKDILRFDGKYDFFLINSKLFISNLSALEKHYGFEDIIKRKAEECLSKIDTKNLLVSSDVLKERTAEISFSRKLTKINRDSPVLNLDNLKVIKFTKKHPELKTAFKYSLDNTQILLDTIKSQNMFIKLLNDDFLRSELTKIDYTSLAKDVIVIENEGV